MTRALSIGAAAGLAVAALLLFTSRGPDPDAVPTVAQVLTRTMSPFCPGLTLDECPSTQAVEVRDQIAAQISAGRTNAQIDSWLVANFGEGALGRPSGAAGATIPIAAGIATLIAVSAVLLSRRPNPTPVDVAPSDHERFRMDFERFEAGNE